MKKISTFCNKIIYYSSLKLDLRVIFFFKILASNKSKNKEFLRLSKIIIYLQMIFSIIFFPALKLSSTAFTTSPTLVAVLFRSPYDFPRVSLPTLVFQFLS